MRGHRPSAIVWIVCPGESLRFEIEIVTPGPPVSGRWCLPGQAPGTFTGWTDLFSALDAAVSTGLARSDVEGSAPATDSSRS